MKIHYKGSKAALILTPLCCPSAHPPRTSSPFTASHCPRPHHPTFISATLEIAASCIRWKSFATNHAEVTVLPTLVCAPPEEVAARTGEPCLPAPLPLTATALVFQPLYSSLGKAHQRHISPKYISSTVTNISHVAHF